MPRKDPLARQVAEERNRKAGSTRVRWALLARPTYIDRQDVEGPNGPEAHIWLHGLWLGDHDGQDLHVATPDPSEAPGLPNLSVPRGKYRSLNEACEKTILAHAGWTVGEILALGERKAIS